MKITKQLLTEMVRKELQKEGFMDSVLDKLAGVVDPSQLSDKAVEVMEAVEQSLDEPSFAKWLGEILGSGSDPEYVLDAVQRNLKDSEFVDWLYDELGLGG